ncbi:MULTISPECIES: hypothetical protein [Nitrospirillum]|uniref:Uncharacterized protein n=2 Tax=Nitrospirillum amazonense TaxID=28077 RepID=A0A560GU11_9PROT|nr:hypothetical protein [Nitrospirillum amazonense]MEC4589939.1 hypothetical protein [Nitrospirillum amazonense]TWB13130.1 hypothetical protein FBZ88_13717 [Nitrospirillum amazonense]TWB37516.1 hypothetical protein FBZ90_1141 [Nitrospirillum amazonense]
MNSENNPLVDRDQPACPQGDWSGFFAAFEGVEIPEDFLSAQERGQRAHDRDPFQWLNASSDLPIMVIEDRAQ